MRLLVCGSRTYGDRSHVSAVLNGYFYEMDATSYEADDLVEFVVIEGGADGADRLAGEWATSHHCYIDSQPSEWQSVVVRLEVYPADWGAPCRDTCRAGHRRQWGCGATYCPAAGAYRNQRMLDEGKPDMVLAFVDKRLFDSKGTSDMVTRAKKAGLDVYIEEKR